MDKLKAEIQRQKDSRSGKGWVKREELESEREQKYLKAEEERSEERGEMMRRKQEAKMIEREEELKAQQFIEERAIERKLEKLSQPPKLPGESLEAKRERLEIAERSAKEPSNDLSEEDLNDPGPFHAREFIDAALAYEAQEEAGELEVLRNEHPFLTEVRGLSYLEKAKVIFTWYKLMLLDWEGKA
jgi:hypothetical protein